MQQDFGGGQWSKVANAWQQRSHQDFGSLQNACAENAWFIYFVPALQKQAQDSFPLQILVFTALSSEIRI